MSITNVSFMSVLVLLPIPLWRVIYITFHYITEDGHSYILDTNNISKCITSLSIYIVIVIKKILPYYAH